MEEISLEVSLGKFTLPTPLIVGAGILGWQEDELSYLIPWEDIGAITTKTITFNPSEGKKGLRVAEVPGGVINVIGLENPGVKLFVESILPRLVDFNKPIIISCAGEEPEEFAKVVSYIENSKVTNNIVAFELNLSCPNVRKGGLEYGRSSMLAYEVVSNVREKTNLPLIAKLTPAVTDILEIARYVKEAGADILCIANTYPVLAIVGEERIIIEGGLSGAPLKPINLRLVFHLHSQLDMPLIGSGGILSPEDAFDYLSVGANAIALGTGLYLDPKLPKKIIEFLKNTFYLKK